MKAIQIIFATILFVATFTTATAQSGIQNVEIEAAAMSYTDAAALLLEEAPEVATEVAAIASLGDQIRQARSTKNVTIEALALATGLTASNIENIEGNMAYPTRDIIMDIEKHLSCEIILDPRMF